MNRLTNIAHRLAAGVMAVLTALSVLPAPALADSSKVVTLGADLSAEQRANVLSFFGLKEADLANMRVVTVTNADERAHLSSSIDLGVIGNQTYSCSYIQPTNSGGIYVQTANLNYVTNYMLYNALQTAGVKNCNLVVTAPFVVSGTGALTGVFMAYEAQGQQLDDAKEQAATSELVTTAELTETYGTGVAEVISDAKNQVISNPGNLTDDQIRDIIRTVAASRGISLQDGDLDRIMQLISQLQQLGYDTDAFSTTLANFESKLREVTQQAQGATGVLEAIGNFFKGIWDWFVGLFTGAAVTDVSQSAQDFFNSFDTSVFQWDNAASTNNANAGANANAGTNNAATATDPNAAAPAGTDPQGNASAQPTNDANAGEGANAPAPAEGTSDNAANTQQQAPQTNGTEQAGAAA